MRSFVKRHPKLSYRKPENVSIGRIAGFTKNNVNIFFNNLATVLEKYKFAPDRIVNTDETGIPTVIQAPKVNCEKGKKQVSQCVSAERGTLVTFCGIVTATGSAIPPVYIFPRVRMKDHFLLGSVTGAKGYASKNGCITAEIFVNVLRHIRQHTNCSPDNKILLRLYDTMLNFVENLLENERGPMNDQDLTKTDYDADRSLVLIEGLSHFLTNFLQNLASCQTSFTCG
jgi:hypothetical protein